MTLYSPIVLHCIALYQDSEESTTHYFHNKNIHYTLFLLSMSRGFFKINEYFVIVFMSTDITLLFYFYTF